MWAADGALGACEAAGGLGGGAAAVFFGAIEADAVTAGDADGFGDGFVAWDFFLDGLDHAAFAAFGGAWDVDFFGDDVVAAGFDLAGFGGVAGGLGADAEHGAAGGEAE